MGEINDPQQKLWEDINLEWANEFQILGFNIDNKFERLHTNVESCRVVKTILLRHPWYLGRFQNCRKIGKRINQEVKI